MTVRVLIVDDSPVARALICSALATDTEIEVVGQCRSGTEALAAIDRLHPDLVTLDIEMPGMDGLETLRRIRQGDRYLPVIMLSSLTTTGAGATLDALALGADDYAAKPSRAGSRDEAVAAMAQELVRKVKPLAARRAWRSLRRTAPARAARQEQFAATVAALIPAGGPVRGRTARYADRTRVSVVAVGASTGGPEALGRILPGLPADLPVPVVVVQHMPKLFTTLLAQRLDKKTLLTVREVTDGEPLLTGCVYIAPGDRHLTVERVDRQVVARLDDEPMVHFARPAVDRLFRSLPGAYGNQVLGLILTGMGKDGLLGCQAVRAAGGRIAVQDEESAAVWGMAGAVVESGLATDTVELDRIAGYVARTVVA